MQQTYVNFQCQFDGFQPIGVCHDEGCEYKGFFCLFCVFKHRQHGNHLYTIVEIRRRIHLIKDLILQIAFYFNKGGNYKYAGYLERFSNVTWLFERIPQTMLQKEFDQEYFLVCRTKFLRNILKVVQETNKRNTTLFIQLKRYLFFYPPTERIYPPNQYTRLLLNVTLIYLLIVIIIRYILQNYII